MLVTSLANAQDGVQHGKQNKFELRLNKKSNRSTKENKKKTSKDTKISKKILKEYLHAIKKKAHKSRREYIFDFLNKISNKNDESIFALRGAINDMLEKYERDTNLAITITRANNVQNKETRKAKQNKYRDLFATQLELPKTGYREEYQYHGSPKSPPKSSTEFDKSSIDRGWKQIFGGLESSKQHTHSPKKPSSLRNSSTFRGQPYTVYLSPERSKRIIENQSLEFYIEEQSQASINTGIKAPANKSDNENLTKEQQKFLEEIDEEVQEHIKNNNLYI
ncbi:17402_t:CDS:2 [Dentiscutata heterogama]|uniref:17402_t:CDS:1 n=1 Tax=Dentiscutata heterogama TaxID=1316150 RepID=A0ACA9KRP9_9GLOM|nr:17402_t:CDS:2 [Dentiscutata heterogama]